MDGNDTTIEDRLRLVDAEVQAIAVARAEQALRVTAGYTVAELSAMPDQQLRRLHNIYHAFVVRTECANCNTVQDCLCDGENYICANRYACRDRTKASAK